MREVYMSTTTKYFPGKEHKKSPWIRREMYKKFARSRIEQNQGRIENRTFKVVKLADTEEGTPIIGSTFIDIFKRRSVDVRYQSQLAAQGNRKQG